MDNSLIFFTKKFPALKMVIKPAKQFHDQNGDPKKTDGEYIQFSNGRFETNEPGKIAFIKEYMKNNQGDITIIDPKKLERDRRIHEKAKQLIDQEDAELAKKGGDRHGKDLSAAPQVPGNYSPATSADESEDEGPNPGDPDDDEDDEDEQDESGNPDEPMPLVTKGQIKKAAKKLKIVFTHKELKDLDACRKVIFKAQEMKNGSPADTSGTDEPNLDDESEK